MDAGAPTCDGLSLSVSASLQWLVLLEDLTEKGPHSPCHFSSLGSSLTLTLLWSLSVSEPITVAGDEHADCQASILRPLLAGGMGRPVPLN